MDENAKTKKKSVEEMVKDLDTKIEREEEFLQKAEKNLVDTKEKIKKLKAAIADLKRKKSALFGDKMLSVGIGSMEELESLLALHREKNPLHEEEETVAPQEESFTESHEEAMMGAVFSSRKSRAWDARSRRDSKRSATKAGARTAASMSEATR